MYFERGLRREFHAHDILTSLVLLTRHDTARRSSYLHARDALLRLVELGVVPVVNENDTVSVAEIKFGDNDTLAALVSCLVSADMCVTLSDIDGLYTVNPSIDPDARFIPRVEKIDATIIGSAGDSSTSVGTGGMTRRSREPHSHDGRVSRASSAPVPSRMPWCALPAARAWALCLRRRSSTSISPRESCGSLWATKLTAP